MLYVDDDLYDRILQTEQLILIYTPIYYYIDDYKRKKTPIGEKITQL